MSRIECRLTRLVVALVLAVLWLPQTGCRAMPFYKPSGKTSQGLSLSREGIAAFERKQYDEAVEKLSESLSLNGDDSEARRYYAESLWVRGKRTEAVAQLNDALEYTANREERTLLYESLGRKYLELGHIDHASGCADRIVELDPTNSQGWTIRAKCATRRGKLQEAITDYQRALTWDPNNPELLSELANLQVELERFDRALAVWQQLERLHAPENEPPDVLYGKSYCLYRLQRYHEAGENLTQALSQAPNRPEFYQLLTSVYLKKGDGARAEAVAQEAMARFPGDAACGALLEQIHQYRLAEHVAATPRLN